MPVNILKHLKQDKLKRVLCCNIPVSACNMKCRYCYVDRERFPEKAAERTYDPELIAKALTQERLGGKAYIHLCAWGETLLDPCILEVTELLLREGHYVGISHNGTVRKVVEQFCNFDSVLKERLHFFISLQWEELKRLGWFDSYAENIKMIKKASISFSVSSTLDDSLFPDIPFIKSYCQDNFGALCHILECRDQSMPDVPRMTKLPLEEHKRIWGEFNSLTFNAQQIHWGEYRSEFCYMGESAVYLDFDSGNIWQSCGGKKLCNIFDDLNEPIRFCAVGQNCQAAHCYLGNILLGLGGVIPEIPYPVFAAQRDRVCSDGTTWYTPKVRAFCSQKAMENLKSYSEKRKEYINAIMTIIYGGTVKQESNDKVKKIFEQELLRKKIKKIMIHGDGDLAKYLNSVMKGINVEVYPFNDNEKLDAVCVTGYDDFPKIRDELIANGHKRILSVLDIVK